MNNSELKCVDCGQVYGSKIVRYRCDCGEVLELVQKDKANLSASRLKKIFNDRLQSMSLPDSSGVWRYRELIMPVNEKQIISKPEGNTNLYEVGADCSSGQRSVGQYADLNKMYIKHEGENPTGSFKDRGMTTGVTVAKLLGMKAVACASTGNTSASLASYAAKAGMTAFVFIPEGKISYGKLAQTIAYGSKTIQIKGDFDRAMELVEKVCSEKGIYLLNSINPFRIEGQKSIAYELMHQLSWEAPDWVIIPAGNLGNTSAIGKALLEMKRIKLINKVPRIASIQAKGANPFYLSYKTDFKKRISVKADTLASAIRIGNPVSYLRAKQIIIESDGLVEQVTDEEILNAKAVVDRSGIGCEPGSATSIAGAKKLVKAGVIKKNEKVVCVITGNILKDMDTILKYHTEEIKSAKNNLTNRIHQLDSNLRSISKIIAKY